MSRTNRASRLPMVADAGRALAVLVVAIVLAAGCGGADDEQAAAEPVSAEGGGGGDGAVEGLVLEPLLWIDNGPEGSEYTLDVYIGDEGKQQLLSLVAEAAAGYPTVRPDADDGTEVPVDLSLIEDTDPEQYFFVIDGYYCTSGGLFLDVAGTTMQIDRTTDVACDAPQPVSSVFRVDRSLIPDGTFSVLGQYETERVEVTDWVVTESSNW